MLKQVGFKGLSYFVLKLVTNIEPLIASCTLSFSMCVCVCDRQKEKRISPKIILTADNTVLET